MPTIKLRTRHGGPSGRRDQLGSLAEMELWLGGPLPHLPPAFDSDEQRRAVWFRHRARMMEQHGSHGRRPVAWWAFEAPFEYPGRDRERSTLYGAGLLAEGEREELLRYWREQFARAHDPNFFYCGGPGKILHGAAARAAHYAWADIPPALVEAWSAEGPNAA